MLSWVFKVVGCWFKDSSLSLFSIWARLVLHMSEIEGGKGVVTNLLEGLFQSILTLWDAPMILYIVGCSFM
jgi:hypothetical protein